MINKVKPIKAWAVITTDKFSARPILYTGIFSTKNGEDYEFENLSYAIFETKKEALAWRKAEGRSYYRWVRIIEVKISPINPKRK